MTEPIDPNHAVDGSEYVVDGSILLGISNAGRADMAAEVIELRLANRHGLVTGATGTGKTVTLPPSASGRSASRSA
jgi:uncharacterized protein